MDRNEASLLIFPFLQSAAFIGACYMLPNSWPIATVLIFIAAIFLCFSLHITYHYHVHFKRRSKTANRLIDLTITALLGVPFHFYQMLHWNHHKYDNAIGDFTSTWRLVGDRPVPRNFITYSLLWPFSGSVKGRDKFRVARREGYFKPRHGALLRTEALLVLVIYGVLFYGNPGWALAYLAMIYVGWCLIAMHNYGQHLPEVYGQTKGNSYYNALYNKLTLNNGLHHEHHHRPSVKYWNLEGPVTAEIRHPHLLEGFFFTRRRKGAPTPTTSRQRQEH